MSSSLNIGSMTLVIHLPCYKALFMHFNNKK